MPRVISAQPGPAAQPIAAAELATTPASPQHPPGLYGRVEAAEDAAAPGAQSGLGGA